ncbi:MAG: DUF2269 domain-containing protein [Pseudomonadota bacterium]
MEYLTLKWIHVVSSTVLFGTGIGLAFFFFAAHRMRDLPAIRFATQMVVRGDTFFTLPAGLVQIASGLALVWLLDLQLAEPWLMGALCLFAFAGACWLPVVWLQIKMRDLAAAAQDVEDLPPHYWRMDRAWIVLGGLAFPALLGVFYLMIFRPGF